MCEKPESAERNMVGLDTHALIRLITNDDPKQAKHARAAIVAEHDPCFVNRATILDLVVTLESGYGYAKTAIADAIDKMLQSADLEIEDTDAIRRANQLYRNGSEYAGALSATSNKDHGCTATLTFDKSAAKQIPHTRLID
jgi:predicted nucleic-acid-binding protein